MPVLIFILTMLGVAAFWWYRIKYIAGAGSEALDAVGRARGSMRRSKLRRQAAESPINAIDNPVIAASTLMFNLANTAPLPPAQEAVIRQQLGKIADGDLLEEAVVYGRWIQTQGLDRRKVTTMTCEKLCGFLNDDERSELVVMIGDLDQDKRIAINKDNFILSVRNLNTN